MIRIARPRNQSLTALSLSLALAACEGMPPGQGDEVGATSEDANADDPQQVGDLGRAQLLARHERRARLLTMATVGARHEDTVEEDGVKMWTELEVSACPLHDQTAPPCASRPLPGARRRR